MGTPCYCSFAPPWGRWELPKRCYPVEEMHRSFCFQVFTSSRARTDIPTSIRLWEVLCLPGRFKYSFNWATAPHQNLAHLYMTCMPESLWEASQINLAVYIQTSQVHNDFEKQLVIPHCSEFHRSPSKLKVHKRWDPNTVLWQPHSNTE